MNQLPRSISYQLSPLLCHFSLSPTFLKNRLLKDSMLSERNQPQKAVYCALPLLWYSGKGKAWGWKIGQWLLGIERRDVLTTKGYTREVWRVRKLLYLDCVGGNLNQYRSENSENRQQNIYTYIQTYRYTCM